MTCPSIVDNKYVASRNNYVLRILLFESGQIQSPLKNVLANLFIFYNCKNNQFYFYIKTVDGTFLEKSIADTWVRDSYLRSGNSPLRVVATNLAEYFDKYNNNIL